MGTYLEINSPNLLVQNAALHVYKLPLNSRLVARALGPQRLVSSPCLSNPPARCYYATILKLTVKSFEGPRTGIIATSMAGQQPIPGLLQPLASPFKLIPEVYHDR
jgi:hypothetical protein